MYSITKEQLQDIYNDGCAYVKEWFPEVFETKLEVGKWYKSDYPLLIFIEEIHHSYLVGYGFNAKNKFLKDDFCRRHSNKVEVDYSYFNFTEATEQEVKTALENEAVKRGFSKGVFVNPLEDKLSINSFEKENKNKVGSDICFDNGNMYARGFGKYCIFKNGVWATIIPTLTKKEAEEKLGVKII